MSNEHSVDIQHGEESPPTDINFDTAAYWSLDPRLLELPDAGACEPALKRLGPLPFPRGSFPLMGFFATVYEHISAHARSQIEKPG